MISFRFHLMSITAVFLALALGIVLGYTVINEATVNTLESRIKVVRGQKDDARDELALWRSFGDEAEDAILAGQLTGVRVVVIAPDGIDGSALDALNEALAKAGAVDAGRIVLSDRWAEEGPATRAAIAGALGIVGPISSEAGTATAAERLAAEFAEGGGPTLAGLITANLVRLEAGDPAVTPGPDARIVIMGDGPPSGFAEPLTRALGRRMPARVLLTDTSSDEEFDTSLVALLRNDPGESRVSTVDHAQTPRGRIAAILALRGFGQEAVGDYGSGAGADRAAPATG